MRNFIFLIFYFGLTIPATAQELSSINWNLENGLPSNQAYQVVQDKKGFIWVCTDHGVARYDGQKFESFSTSDGLTDNTIFRIYNDYKGRLWFLGRSGTLCYWDGNKVVAHEANEKLSMLLVNPSITTNMAIDSNDVIYFTTGTKAVDGYYSIGVNDTTIYFTPYEEQGVKETGLLIINERTNLLLNRFHKIRNQNKWKGPRKIPKFSLRDISSMNWVMREYREPKRKQVFFRNGVVYIYDMLLDSVTEFKLATKKERFLSVYLDSKEQLWVSQKEGLFFYGKAPFVEKPRLFFENILVASITEDREGNYWVATLNRGVFFIKNWEVLHFYKDKGAIVKVISRKEQIFGIGGRKVYKLNNTYPFEEEVITVDIPKPVDLFDIKEWNNKLLLSSGILIDPNDGGLVYDEKIQLKPYHGKTIYIDSNDESLLLGCSNGLFEIKEDSIEYLLNQHWINAIEKKNLNEWLLGTPEGLCIYDKRKNKILNLGKRNPLLLQQVLTIRFFQNKWLVGTKGNGVLLLDSESYEVLDQWTNTDGLSSAFVHCITIENDTSLWVGTSQGANKIRVLGTKIKNCQTLNIDNFLPSNGVNDILIKNEAIWMATDKGISHIPKETLEPSINNIEIPLYIKGVYVNGVSLKLQDYYSLEYNQSNLIIDFVALSFGNQKSMNYRYQLKKKYQKTRNWTHTSQTQINCNNLAPDNYSLLIEVKNKNGKWQKKGIQLDFEIKPHFTGTISFYLLIIGLAIFVVFIYVRSLIAKKNLEKELSEAEQKSLRSQLKPHFLFNAINSVVYFLYKNQKKQAISFLQKFATLMRSTLELTQHPLVLLEHDIRHLQLYLDMELERLSSGSTYQHDFDIEISNEVNQLSWQIPPMLIQPLVENAIVHGLSPKEGDRKLLVLIKEINQKLVIIVEDNGIGRGASKKIKKQFFIKKTSQGLKMLKQRIRIIHNLLNVDIKLSVEDVFDNASCSTRFIISFPSSLKK